VAPTSPEGGATTDERHEEHTATRRDHQAPRIAVGAAVAAAIAGQTFWMGPAVVGLDIGLAAAFAVWSSREAIGSGQRASITRLFVAGIALQTLHFLEELSTGFPRALPGFFGYAWSDAKFSVFNALWLTIFVVAALAVSRGWRPAELVLWFFALVGCVANGVFHVTASAIQRAYFPGLLTAPLLFALGLVLTRLLLQATDHRSP